MAGRQVVEHDDVVTCDAQASAETEPHSWLRRGLRGTLSRVTICGGVLARRRHRGDGMLAPIVRLHRSPARTESTSSNSSPRSPRCLPGSMPRLGGRRWPLPRPAAPLEASSPDPRPRQRRSTTTRSPSSARAGSSRRGQRGREPDDDPGARAPTNRPAAGRSPAQPTPSSSGRWLVWSSRNDYLAQPSAEPGRPRRWKSLGASELLQAARPATAARWSAPVLDVRTCSTCSIDLLKPCLTAKAWTSSSSTLASILDLIPRSMRRSRDT